MKAWIIVVIFVLAASVHAEEQDRFVSKLILASGQTVVVAEGEFEARSTGSFDVRLYEAAEAPNETTFFVDGLIRPRDGFVEKIILADIDGDKTQEIIVIIRSVGTGNYLSAQAFAISKNKLVFRSKLEDLAPDVDPVKLFSKSR